MFGGTNVAYVPSLRQSRGASLIEVLVAVLIFTIGLVGLAGLLITATKSNASALVRTQATFLANNMADRMRANPWGLWNGSYNATYPVTGTAPACDAATGCKPSDVAKRDQIVWSQQLQGALPGLGATTIACDKATAGFDATSQYAMRPPYGGSCTMTITWSERGVATGGGDDRTDSANLQSFSWVFQP